MPPDVGALPAPVPATPLEPGLHARPISPLDSFFLDAAPDREPSEPAPAPVYTRFDEAEWSGAVSAPEAPAAAAEPAPPADDGLPTWAGVVESLRREAEATGAAELKVDAARAAWIWLGDAGRASALLADAPEGTPGRARLAAELALGRDAAAVRPFALEVSGSRGAAWLRRAAALSAGGPDALLFAREAAGADPTDLLSWWALRDEAMRQGAEDEVQDALRAILSATEGELAADAGLALAARLKRQGRSDEATAMIRAAAGADPDHSGVFAALEAELIEGGQWSAVAAQYAARASAAAPTEARWWWILSARASRAAGQADAAADAFAQAAASGSRGVFPEQIGWLLSSDAPSDREVRLDRALAAASDALQGDDLAALLYLRGHVAQSWLGDSAVAEAVWQTAAELGFGPASAARLGALATSADSTALLAALDEAIALAGPDGAVAERIRRTELAEREQAAGEEVFNAWVTLVAQGAGRRALEGVQRVARRRDETLALVDALEGLGAISRTELGRGEVLGEAAQVLRYKLRDAARAAVLLKASPRHVPRAWEIDVAMAIEAGQHAEAAGFLSAAIADEEPAEAADLLFRSALLLHTAADGATRREAAVEALEQAVALDPSHADASLLLAELTGGARADLRRAAAAASPAPQGAQAVRALTWVYGAAAGDDGEAPVGGLFDAISAWVVGRPAAAATWAAALPDVEDAAVSAALTLTAAAEDASGTNAAAARAACDGLQSASPGGSAAAHIALMCGNPTAALRALEGAGSISAAQTAVRIAETLGGPALTSAIAALDALAQPAPTAGDEEGEAAAPDPRHPAALSAARARLRAARGDHAATAAGHLKLAALEPSAQVRAAHARRAAQLFTALARPAEATEGLKLAVDAFREVGDGHAEAWEALAEAQRAAGDAAAAVDTLQGAPLPEGERARLVAELTTRAGLSGQADAWELAAAAAGLYERLGHEVALAHEARWAELFDGWSGRHETSASEEERAILERSRRLLLAEKLAETELAIQLYERLHAESPDDREVLENLARVAGARGETDRSIAWLEELAESAATPIDAARYHRRIAETWIRANDDAYARQAFLNALDFQPDDQAALAGLEALAAKAEDWDALRSVLQRKASICPAGERKDVLRQIARLVDERFTDRGEALDAWRAVTEVDPQDSEALWRMLDLADAAGEHDAMLEIGNQLEARLEGGERSKLLSRLGAVCEDLGRRDDAIHYFEQAVAAEEPDPNASVRLEGLYRAGQDHAGVVRAILAQASLASDDAVRVERMLTAARIEQEMRHDREAASRLFEEVLRVDPGQTDALRMHADWLWDTGRGEDALPLFERAAPVLDDLTPEADAAARLDGAVFYFRYGDVLRVAGRRDEAISRYLAALALHPHHLPSLEAAGPLLVDAERWTEAGDVWQRVAAITAGGSDLARSAHVITQIARVDAATGETDRAWAGFNRALMLHPNDVAALRGLANILEGRRDWNALLTVYNNIIYHATLPGDVIAAYMTKGRVLDENLDRQDKAVQHYERSLAFEARQPAAYLRLAELALRRDSAEDAVTYASRGLDVAEAGPMKADLHIARALGLLATDYGAAAESEIALAVEADATRNAMLGASPLSDPTSVRAALRSRLPR